MSHPTDHLLASLQQRQAAIAVIGLGYVGLSLAVCLSRHFRVIGFDTNRDKIAALKAGKDPIGECSDQAIAASGITFSDAAADLSGSRLYIVAVPTPIDADKRPDFTPLIQASATIGQHLAKGSVVVYESTVYPGATEEICIPVLERESGLVAGRDFTFGYSPERINPGDREHTVDKVCKIVSGSDAITCDVLAGVYGAAIPAGVYRAPSIKVAEAAKVLENTQRDVNIALMNEMAMICHRLGIDTGDVLTAAGTKWNFLPFRPGLAGGHCIGIDPYYLAHKAQAVGYQPDVILSARRVNDAVGVYIAQECVRLMSQRGLAISGALVLILGFSFKEDCPDVRNTRVIDILAELKRQGCVPLVVDPVADATEARREHGVELIAADPLPACEAVVIALAHRQFRQFSSAQLLAACPRGPVLDIKGIVDRAAADGVGLNLWRL